MTKAEERRDVLAAFADWILERAKQLGGQGGAQVQESFAAQPADSSGKGHEPAGFSPAAAPANPVVRIDPVAATAAVPTMSPMPWATDILGRPVQSSPVPSTAVAVPPSAPGPFYEQYVCPMCHNMREWKMNRARWPNAVCADCFRRSRGTQ